MLITGHHSGVRYETLVADATEKMKQPPLLPPPPLAAGWEDEPPLFDAKKASSRSRW